VFASVGWNVVISARTPSQLEQVLKELEGLKGNVIAVPTDVSDYEQVQRLIKETKETFGRVDVVINSAGIDYPGSIEELGIEQWN
jgi:NADP-dependent 3-hydroxy acid dehydrogenase YdfG